MSGVEPNITWAKEKPGSQGNIGVVQEGKVLTITNIDRSDAGTFTCTAYNGYGKLEKRIEYMNVTFECALIEKNFDQCEIEMNFPFIFCTVMSYIPVLMFNLINSYPRTHRNSFSVKI